MLAGQAGLRAETGFDTTWAIEYPDEETLGRALVAVAGLALLAGPEREEAVKAAIVTVLRPTAPPTGATGSRTSSTT